MLKRLLCICTFIALSFLMLSCKKETTPALYSGMNNWEQLDASNKIKLISVDLKNGRADATFDIDLPDYTLADFDQIFFQRAAVGFPRVPVNLDETKLLNGEFLKLKTGKLVLVFTDGSISADSANNVIEFHMASSTGFVKECKFSTLP